MDDRHANVRALLREAADLHHRVFRITDGADEDWASWYADWLVNLSEFGDLMPGPVVRSEVTHMLVVLEHQHREGHADEPWEEFYARELLRHFGEA